MYANQTTGVFTTSNAMPSPSSPMQDARSALTCAIEMLHERIAELERRLDTVCAPTAPAADGRSGAGANSPISEQRIFLLEQAGVVGLASARLESLLGRIEL